jgi:LacI family transcriptional regulator
MSSLQEVARRAGVSIATASLVLNPGKQECRVSEACAARVRKIATRLGYVPNYHAQSMKKGRAGVLAVALDLGSPGAQVSVRGELGMSYFGTIIGAIEARTRSLGFQMTVVGPDEKLRAPDRGLLGVRQRRFDGLIVPGTAVRSDATDFLSVPHDEPIVVVEYGGKTELPVVDWDEKACVRLAVHHLAALGHRELLWLGPPSLEGAPAHGREEMFLNCVQEAGLKGSACRHDKILWGLRDDYASRIVDASELALARRLREGEAFFTGVVAYNDVTAIGACSALHAAGLKIPADVSVVGIDDVEAPLCIPRLTSVSHKLPEMGTRATELVLEIVEDPKALKRLRGSRELIQPELIVRKSTGPAKR